MPNRGLSVSQHLAPMMKNPSRQVTVMTTKCDDLVESCEITDVAPSFQLSSRPYIISLRDRALLVIRAC